MPAGCAARGSPPKMGPGPAPRRRRGDLGRGGHGAASSAAGSGAVVKTIPLESAAALVPDGATLMIGGFMGVGSPERLIDELLRQGRRDLTVIANDTAMPGRGIGKLVAAGALRKAVVSHIGLIPETQRRMIAGELEVELVP